MQTENERLSRGKQKMLQGPFLLCGWETGLDYVCVSVFGEGRGGGGDSVSSVCHGHFHFRLSLNSYQRRLSHKSFPATMSWKHAGQRNEDKLL